MRKPGTSEIRALEYVEQVTKHSNGVYQYANSSREIRIAVLHRCEDAGWLEADLCVAVDGDGGLLNGNERQSIGFKLTAAGEALLAELHAPRNERAALLKRLWDERDKAIEERNEARALVEQLMAQRVLTCVYCGHDYPQDTPAHGHQILTEHITVCEKHPMRGLVELLAEAVQRLEEAQLIGQMSHRFQAWILGGVVPIATSKAGST